MRLLIAVSRHPGAIEWLREEGHVPPDMPFKSQVGPEDVEGKVVIGNIPLHLAALAHEVRAIEFAGPPPRGSEYSAEDMRSAGACLRSYRVQVVDPDDPDDDD